MLYLAAPTYLASQSQPPMSLTSYIITVPTILLFCRHMSGRKYKPTILNTLNKMGVWNCHVLYLAAPTYLASQPPMSLTSYIIRVPTILLFCRHMSGRKFKPTILNTLNKMGVWNCHVLYLAAPTYLASQPPTSLTPYIITVPTILLFFVGT